MRVNFVETAYTIDGDLYSRTCVYLIKLQFEGCSFFITNQEQTQIFQLPAFAPIRLLRKNFRIAFSFLFVKKVPLAKLKTGRSSFDFEIVFSFFSASMGQQLYFGKGNKLMVSPP